jgi:hypothetical protein
MNIKITIVVREARREAAKSESTQGRGEDR